MIIHAVGGLNNIGCQAIRQALCQIFDGVDLNTQVYCGGDFFGFHSNILVPRIDPSKAMFLGITVSDAYGYANKVYERHVDLLKAMQGVSVRDRMSYDWMTKHGVPCVLAADPTYVLEPTTPPEYITKFIQDRPTIAFSANLLPSSSTKPVYQFLQDRVSDGYNIIIIPMQFPANLQYTAKLPVNRHILTVREQLSYTAVKGIAKLCDYVVSGSTHLCIAGYAGSTPTMPLATSSKSVALDKDLFDEPYYVQCNYNKNLSQDLNNRWEKLVEDSALIRAKLESIDFVAAAENNRLVLSNIRN